MQLNFMWQKWFVNILNFYVMQEINSLDYVNFHMLIEDKWNLFHF